MALPIEEKQLTDEVEGLLNLRQFHELKYRHIIPIREVGIDMAQIAYWRREGLLPFIAKGKWAKVSFVEAIWLQVLDSVRSLGVSTETMKNLNYYFVERAAEDHVPRKTLEYHKAILEKRKALGTLTAYNHYQLHQMNALLKNEAVLEMHKADVNYFSNLLTESVLSKSEASILIFADGTVAELLFGTLRTFPKKDIDTTAPHIRLSMNHYLSQFITSEEMSEFLLSARLYTEDEARVLREVRTKNVREIVITLAGNKVQRIESTKDGVLSREQAAEVRRILGLKNYERITLDTRDEKTLSFKRTKKRL